MQTALKMVSPPDRGIPAPLLFHFKTDRACYVYEAATNEILRVPEAFWEASQSNSFWQKDPAPGTIDVPGQLKEAREKGFFLGGRPRGMDPAITRPAYEKKAATGLNQLILCITEACNLRCDYCLFSDDHPFQRRHNTRHMSLETACRAVDFFLDRNHKAENRFISFYGGEPTLNFPVVKATVNHAKLRGLPDLSFNLTTNGYALTREMLEFFIKNRFALLISLDGPALKHDAYRKTLRGNPTHERVMDTLGWLQKTAPEYCAARVRLSIVIAPPYDITALKEYFDHSPLFNGVGFNVSTVSSEATRFFQIPRVKQALNQKISEDRGFEALFQAYCRNLIDDAPYKSRFLSALFETRFLRMHKRALFKGYEKFIPANGNCTPGLRRLYINTDGTFKICERVNDSLEIGNLDTGIDTDRVFALMTTYTRQMFPKCRDCAANRLCTVCFACGFNAQGFSSEARDEECRQVRTTLVQTLAAYCEILEKNPAAFDYMKQIDFG